MSQHVTVVGAGPSGLMAAQVLAEGGAHVTIVDHMESPARKFLLAGRGGLNLTHSGPLESFLSHYGEARTKLEPAIRGFTPDDLKAWCARLGIETFVGSSGRIFPKQLKASPLLRAWLRQLQELNVKLESQKEWQSFDGSPTILAMGGASWPHLGSNAAWVPVLRERGIDVKPFKPANCRFRVQWSHHISERHAGSPIKNIAAAYRGHRVRGEIMLSRDGIEGGAIYALSPILRDAPGDLLLVDLKPDLTLEVVATRLEKPRGKDSASTFLRKVLGLSPAAIALLHEARQPVTPALVKAVPIAVDGPIGVDRAISSAGGVSLEEIDENFQLLNAPGCYVVGEMLDWEAPTGGYLLQACFSTAVAAARHCLLNHRVF
jgi:uncharacterized flavoprotein (TIGR03862 family)